MTEIVMVDAKALQELTNAVRDVLECHWERLSSDLGSFDVDHTLGHLKHLEAALKAFERLPGDV